MRIGEIGHAPLAETPTRTTSEAAQAVLPFFALCSSADHRSDCARFRARLFADRDTLMKMIEPEPAHRRNGDAAALSLRSIQ